MPKKNQAKKCRTISLIVARILCKRLELVEEFIEEDQFGFPKGKGTRDAIGLMEIISGRVRHIKKDLCLCFIDWQKAFDCVAWTKLLEMPRNTGVNWREV